MIGMSKIKQEGYSPIGLDQFHTNYHHSHSRSAAMEYKTDIGGRTELSSLHHKSSFYIPSTYHNNTNEGKRQKFDFI